ncbi:hypothetical protein JY651_29030 [Pyxidicoccus parkwayensis]|uniref:Uncharacterized protein n=1 Tax=Pyxidicoccus parkwayensis TaxID=2813578 RepID=A0ABX7NLR6_9BACT|nr:hypothetical protein [Pyxidicoccus parkwaysis]QSQ19371.1 hypothetical protein JY651_29030 [Pyxidicoccus parkwaysis]
MSDIRVVLFVLALCPCLAWAQSSEFLPPPLIEVEDARDADVKAARDAEVRGTRDADVRDVPVRDEARPSAEAVTEAQWKPDPPGRVAGRVVMEAMGGAVAGVGGGFVGVMAMLPLGNAAWGCAGDTCDASGLVAGGIMGWSLGSALGVYGAGSMLEGRGRLLPTLGLGLLAGGAATGLYLTDVAGDDAALLLLALPLTTSIITYEMTSASAQPRALAAAHDSGVWWTPTVGMSSHGGALGLTGRF